MFSDFGAIDLFMCWATFDSIYECLVSKYTVLEKTKIDFVNKINISKKNIAELGSLVNFQYKGLLTELKYADKKQANFMPLLHLLKFFFTRNRVILRWNSACVR